MPPKLTTTNDSNGNKSNNNRTNPNEQQQEHLKTKKNGDQSRRIAIEGFAESVHLIQGFADTLDAIPPSLTRSLSDLKELDAVLSTPLNQLNTTLDQLINSLKHPQSLQPSQRLQLLRNMMSDIESYKLGAQDKIRVANGTCESLSHHIRQLDTTTSLLISSLPPSLESRIPPSTFPTGYPKLSGSLRSKPIGGVWQNSNPSNLQQPSPPSISTREFINFHQDSPVRQVYHHPNSNRPFDPQVPLTKRPRLGQFNHPDDDSSLVRRDQADVGGRSSRLLDQHIYSQSVLDKHRAGAQDDHHHHHPSEPRAGNPQYDHHLGARSGNSTGATSSTLARQHSQLGLASPNANNLNAPSSKNKRSRISCGLAEAEAEAEDWSNPGARLNATPQQSAAVGLKKRVRKSNPIGSVGKNADRLAPNLEDSAGGLAKMTDQKAGGTVTSPSPHANKASTIPFAGGTTRKTGAGGVRQTIGNSSKAADGAPVVTKRAYTKRSGLGNTTAAAGGSKGKRGNGKKSGVGTGNEGGSSAETGKDSGTRGKADQVVGERGRKGAGTKEGVRLEDVVEGGGSGKGRGRKTGPHAGDIGTLSRRGGGGLAGETEEVWSNVGGDEWEDDGGSGKLVSQGMVLKGQSSQKGQDDEEGVDSADGGAPPSSESNHSSSAKAYCICRGEVYGDRMVACDNSECPIEWFHYQCAGLTEDPTGNWFCPDCQSKGLGCIT